MAANSVCSLSPRLRGEGWGEGPEWSERRGCPSPGPRYALATLSPQARGEGAVARSCSSRASLVQPLAHGLHQRLAQARMLDALDRLADERLDQQRLGLL